MKKKEMRETYLKFHFEPFRKIKLNLEDKKKLLIINEKKGNERNLPEVPFRTLPKDEAKSRRYKKLFIINKKIQKKRNSPDDMLQHKWNRAFRFYIQVGSCFIFLCSLFSFSNFVLTSLLLSF